MGMSNRTFKDIARYGHPDDPQLWGPVDEAYQSCRAVLRHLGEALDELENMHPEPVDWVDQIVILSREIESALSGKQEEDV